MELFPQQRNIGKHLIFLFLHCRRRNC
ncbi:hypothetical protein MTR67_032511 [Solanum verrucosum]|uniref:Uncharacterized protein n=1 Tax=Solanum verrucosum TaxID=315347 RepID=A0AAF0U4M3_SOLVR|nr:hypothetical protein MTR67_032511 [Solanum verrucosum]